MKRSIPHFTIRNKSPVRLKELNRL